MTHNHQKGLTYRDAGVDINAGNALIERIKPHAKRTARKESLGTSVASAFFKIPEGYVNRTGLRNRWCWHQIEARNPVPSSQQIGEDLVAMCVNDLIVSNAQPLFFSIITQPAN